ncbi:MAG: putative metallopeptidase [Nanoarchaeota archaeon]|nr:metallopeptidase [Nanoarchaeota archaeon]
MKYEFAPDIQEIVEEIVRTLNLNHVKTDSVQCFRSIGTNSRNIIARCHGLGKVMQKALDRKGFYVLEFLTERFDRQSEEEQIKTIIHEIMHIPKSFGGGFKHHNFVTEKNVNTLYQEFMLRKESKPNFFC